MSTSRKYNSLVYNTSLARSFIKENLPNLPLTSTYTLGKKVYNIRDIESNKVVGFLGYLVSYNKLPSLVSFLYKKGTYNICIIISYRAYALKYYTTIKVKVVIVRKVNILRINK